MQLGELRVAARLTRHARIVHGHEDAVGADEGEPEMPPRQTLVHHAAEHFGEPVVGGGKNPEDGGHAHDQVEVAGHEIGVVQRNIQAWAAPETVR